MNRKLSSKLALVVALMVALLLSSPSAARADSLIVTLISPVMGGPGDTLQVIGTIEAQLTNGGPIYLNSDALTLPGPFALDDTPFLSAPLSMAPGDIYSGVLFTVSIAPSASEGAYTGYFTILGGSNQTALDPVSNTASFEVRVVPEPTTILLFGTGLAGVAWGTRRRKGAQTIVK